MKKYQHSAILIYFQVISDWQAWNETQTAELQRVQESLDQYSQAYNQAVEEVNKLKESEGAAATPSDPEIDKLRAAVKTKDIEIEELSETLDRQVAALFRVTINITDHKPKFKIFIHI